MSENKGDSINVINKEPIQETLRVDMEQVVLTGSPWFPKYGKDQSDTDRGNLTIENMVEALKEGYKVCYLISHSADPNDPYIQALQRRLEEEKEKNTEFNAENLFVEARVIPVYGEARKAAMTMAVERFSSSVVSLQEAEKNLTPFLRQFAEPFFKKGEKRAAIVTMRRASLRSLPHNQAVGEGIQDSLIHGQLADAGIPVGSRPEDVLNGTRFILNELVETNYDMKVNPLDLFTRLNFAYDPETARQLKDDKTYTYGIDRYSAAVYFPLVVARELGLRVQEVEVDYKHDQAQTKLENRDDEGVFLERRIKQATDIVGQNFDLVASILRYKELRRWPQVLRDALDEENPQPLEIWHFETREWEIRDGKLVKRETGQTIRYY